MTTNSPWKSRPTKISLYRIVTAIALAFCLQATAQNYSTPFTFTTVAGSSTGGWQDGTNSAARLRSVGIAMDVSGNFYLADLATCTIRQVQHQGTNWIVTTIAGSTNAGYADGVGTNAQFSSPWSITVDTATNIYLAGRVDQTIRKIAPLGTNWVVTTLAGTPLTTGFANGTGFQAKFNIPNGVCVDTNGNVYVGDSLNNMIRKVTPSGVVTTVAGSGVKGYADGPGTTAKFYFPHGLKMDGAGNIIVADTYNHVIRKVSPVGTNWVVSTVAGIYQAGSPEPIGGFVDGGTDVARFHRPYELALSAYGDIYVSDCWSNSCLRKISPQGTNWIVSTIGGSPHLRGYVDGTGPGAQFFGLYGGIVFDAKGNLMVADAGTLRIGVPSPRIARTGDKAILSWAASGYAFEQSASVSDGALWTPLLNPIAFSNGTFYVTNSMTGPQNFFRLR